MSKMKNKGFTLVELLVAMAVLAVVMAELAQVIFSSSRLYLNGTYEVDLQTEAQQIILQIEDMLVDARVDVSANYVATISSDDIITISTNSISTNEAIEYKITFVPDYTGANEYGELYLTVKDNSGTSDPIFMADYVRSVSLDFVEYETDNMLTLYVSMYNGKYSYTTSKDIFLRNMLGTGARKRGNQRDSNDMEDLEVLRYGQYELRNLYKSRIDEYENLNPAPAGKVYTYSFEWDSNTTSSLAGGVDLYYDLSSDGHLECGPTLNSQSHFDDEIGGLGSGECQVKCYAYLEGVKQGEVFTIQLGTQKVSVGLGLGYTNTYSSYGIATIYGQIAYGEKLWSNIPVQGIDITRATETSLEASVAYNGETSEVLLAKTGDLNSSPLSLGSKDLINTKCFTSQTSTGDTPANPVRAAFDCNPGGSWDFGIWKFDPEHNALIVETDRCLSGNVNAFLKFCNAGYRIRTNASFHFEQGSDSADLDFSTYYFIYSENITSDIMDKIVSGALLE